jgi:hypothetical protein
MRKGQPEPEERKREKRKEREWGGGRRGGAEVKEREMFY